MSEQAQEPGQPVEEPAQEPDEPVASPGPLTPEEQEQADQNEQGEESGEGEGPEAKPLSERDVEQAFAKLDKEATRHANRVSEIMEEGAQLLVACPLCEPSIPGFVMPSPAVEERKPGVLLFLGITEPRDLRPAERATRCATCDGWGEVAMPTHVEAQAALQCEVCKGKGWIGEHGTATFQPAAAPQTPVGQNGPPSPTLTAEEEAVAAQLRAKGVVVYVPPVVT